MPISLATAWGLSSRAGRVVSARTLGRGEENGIAPELGCRALVRFLCTDGCFGAEAL
jgi:hypothetical protein